MSTRIWITWENHRRSKELSSEFDAEYYPLVHAGKRPVRYVILIVKTIHLLLKRRPDVVFCQNPSLILTTILTFCRSAFSYKLIVDRHSNFKLEYADSRSLKWRIFHFLSSWTIKRADLTIVTNEDLQRICNDLGGRSEVLQDKLPNLAAKRKRPPPFFMTDMNKTQVMFVTTFDSDEPIDEITEAAKSLKGCVCYLTGNCRKYFSDEESRSLLNYNVVLTGFVSDDDYLSLMENVDIVVVLTKKDLILNCGAYEAISMDKPLILSDTPTLRRYFERAALYCEPDPLSIKSKILEASHDLNSLIENQAERKGELEGFWNERFKQVQSDNYLN